MLVALAGEALPVSAMPIGLRTAIWGVSGANGRAAVSRLLPETESSAEIKVVLKEFSDETVAANITDHSEYEEFREWALETGARADVLTASTTAYLSFATGSPVLVAEPQDGDLVIDEVSSIGADGTIEMLDSYVPGWGDWATGMTEGKFENGTITWNLEYTDYPFYFIVTMYKR